MKIKRIIIIGAFVLAAGSTCAQTFLTEDFQNADISAWITSGTGSAVANLYSGNYSLRANRTLSATKTFSTVGYTGVTVSLDLAAYSLEGSDTCYTEASIDGGSNWSTLVSVANGSDNSSFYSYNGSPSGVDNNSNFKLRLRANGNRNNDYCYLDNIVIEGTSGDPEINVSGSGDLGSVELSSSSTSVITISNNGNAALAVATLSNLSSPYNLSADNCSNTFVNIGNSCTATIEFSPTVLGVFGDTLTINSNDNDNDNDESVIDVALTGIGTEAPATNCTYDCLSGNGNVIRTEVTYLNLTGSADNGSLVDFSGFTLPSGADNPSNTFEGSLSFTGTQRGWIEVEDPYLYKTLSGVKSLPDFNYKFVQHGTHIIPEQRGLIESASALGQWDLILEPGRVWDENSDNNYSRAAIPFALVEYNQNCTHNGVLSFLFDDNGDISNVQYQIASETCAYFQFNMYGRLSANYNQSAVSNAATIKAAYETEVANRMTTKAISELAIDYPSSGISISNIASDQSSGDLSLFGVSYNGVHYVGGCETRYGTYPFCDVMTLPSYSTAKSVVAGLSLMRLEQKYVGAKDVTVKDYVSECSDTNKWGDVTLGDALDMATGNYDSSAYESDEVDYATNWLYSNTHTEKVNISCNYYGHKENAGQTWVYHSSDTYLVGLGINDFLQDKEGSSKEFFTDMLISDVFAPLGLSPSMSETIRTRDTESAAVTGLGLFFHRDDVVKLADMLNNDNGMINGVQVLNSNMVNAALQRNANDRGLPTDPSASNSYYNNGFWGYDLSSSTNMDNCSNETWIPYMSGYGGIGIQMLPNGMAYYFFSDGSDHYFTKTMNELDKISSLCN